jgi:transcriptional regulator with XRE-family HTH domain
VLDDAHEARLAAGLSQQTVALAIGTSRQGLSRLEHAVEPIDLIELARYGAAVGLDISIRAYPAGEPIRDVGQVRLLERFFDRLHPSWRRAIEVPVGDHGQAWDAVAWKPGARVAVEALTRIRDIQAQSRPILRKLALDAVDALVLLVAETVPNRRALHAASEVLSHDFPLGTRAVMAALAVGEPPAAHGIVRM